MTQVIPVILAGGAGTRLWPLSRRAHPKQFLPLIGDSSLFRATARRVAGPDFAPPLIITGSDFRFLVTGQLHDEGMDTATVLIEPEGRNTAPAVLAAALWLERHDPEALMLVLPSDHAIPDPDLFVDAVQAGAGAAQAGQLVTFGVTPTRPETGYGYLELDGLSGAGAVGLKRFVEKPDLATAQAFLAQGNYLWNAGIFLFSVRAILAAFDAHAPDMVAAVRAAVDGAAPDLSFVRLATAPWAGVADISLDYAVMEKADNLVVVPFEGGWSDLGDWQAVGRAMPTDAAGNALRGNVTALGCENALLRSDQDDIALVGLGLKDMIVVATRDAVLVADTSRAQEVKEAVAALDHQHAPQATEFPWSLRPWGAFDTLARGHRFQVKKITVKPGGILSLQSHHHRAEHWIVVQGTALVTIDGEERLVTENQSVYVPIGAVHRLQNPGKLPMVLIEVQTGGYLGEDDITRFEDVYDRAPGDTD